MRALFVCLSLLSIGFAGGIATLPSPAQAAITPQASQGIAAQTELVVIETLNCAYCRVFRRELLPAYAASSRAKDMPIRFLKVNEVGRAGISLRQPISIVPTTLVLEEGREIGRIPGLTGHDTFFRAIQMILRQQ